MTTIEQWKSRAFISILACISITVNASYARIQRRYQNSPGLVQRMQQQAQPAPVITPPATPAVRYVPAPERVPVAYMSAPAPEPSPAPFVPVTRQSSPLDAQVIAKLQNHRLTEQESLLQKEEREEKKEAREAAMTDRAAKPDTNAVEVAKTQDKDITRGEQADRPHRAGMSPTYSDPEASKQLAQSQDEMLKRALEEKITPLPPANSTSEQEEAKRQPNHAAQLDTMFDTKTASAPNEAKTAPPPPEVKTPPLAPSRSVLDRIRQGVATGGQSGAQYQTHSQSSNSRQPVRSQNNQSQQTQQNRNQGNEGGGGSGHTRH